MIQDKWIKTPRSWQTDSIEKVIAVMYQTYGVDISYYDEPFLVKSLENRQRSTIQSTLDKKTPEAYLTLLSKDRVEAMALAQSLRVTYSEFFRNQLSFALLRQLILPNLVDKRINNQILKNQNQNEIRVWSSGCATGQEVWSLAILLDEILSLQEPPIPFRIFGTDASEANLSIASAGIYNEEAMGNVCLKHIGKYFTRQGESFVVVPRIRERVDFSVYDLLDKTLTCPSISIYGHFDLVLCCNVLLYYSIESKQLILNKLWGCLAPFGYLITGEAERQCVGLVNGFRAIAPPAAIFQKNGKK
ncbi:MAG: protein-glutamate O-methyltransferase CheR [Desulfamplus sp.]|nr:protein-glutamate O-methyltransferase CheR [Desulfamplus sp.]